jgi:hypothetical protein
MWDDFFSAFLESLWAVINGSKPRSKFDTIVTILFLAFFVFIIGMAIYNNL